MALGTGVVRHSNFFLFLYVILEAVMSILVVCSYLDVFLFHGDVIVYILCLLLLDCSVFCFHNSSSRPVFLC